MSIEIVAKKGGTSEVIDEAKNKKEAKNQVDYWQRIKGKGWKIFTKAKR